MTAAQVVCGDDDVRVKLNMLYIQTWPRYKSNATLAAIPAPSLRLLNNELVEGMSKLQELIRTSFENNMGDVRDGRCKLTNL